MMNFSLFFYLCFFLVNWISCSNHKDPVYWRELSRNALYHSKTFLSDDDIKQAKNVIIFLGDGMGMPSISAARLLKRQITNKNDDHLVFEQFDHTALIQTYNIDYAVPDSAGTGTAFCTGVKTNRGTIGVNGNVNYKDTNCELLQENIVETVFEKAAKSGKSVGFVTTASITDATPAATYAHVSSRYDESSSSLNDDKCKDIALQLIEDHTEYRVMLGGGRKNFLPKGKEVGKREDNRDLFEEWQYKLGNQTNHHHYEFVSTKQELSEIDYDKVDYLLGSFCENHMKFDKELKNDTSETEPTIEEMTVAALQILKKNKNGFFLMVEGAKIDKAHHTNQAFYSLHDLLAFEKAIIKAQSMVNLKETLIIVTADHSHSFTHSGSSLMTNDLFGFSDYTDRDGKNFTSLIYSTGPGYKESRNYTEKKSNKLTLLKYRPYHWTVLLMEAMMLPLMQQDQDLIY
nr:alkaline phosphatase, tissue-nonspecific isozyme-like isoform X2 [Dermatophagoides farinae]